MADSFNFTLYKRLFRYITPYKFAIAGMLSVLIILAGLEPFKAVLMEKLFDEGLISGQSDLFIWIPIQIAGLFIVLGFFEYGSKVMSQWVAQKAIMNIRADMFSKMHRLPLATQQAYGTGKLMSKITYDVTMAGSTLSNAWVVIIRDTLIVIALLGYLTYQSWQLTSIILIVGPLMAFILDRASKMMRSSSKAMQKNMGDITQQLEESIRGFRDIKIYGTEDYENKRFLQTAKRLFRHSLNVTKVSALNVPLVQVIAAIALSIIISFAILMVNRGELTAPELLAYITAMALIFEPIRRLTNINETVQKGMAAAESIFQLLDQEEEIDNGTQTLPEQELSIHFKDVSFKYPSTDTWVIKDLNLTIEANKTTALVGQSGSGKTTIAHLIAGFYPIEKGTLEISGSNINDISLSSLRDNIAFVSQDIALFDDTVAANIAYGQTEYDDDEVKQAAINAHAWEFIQKLPQGLQTPVGDDGCNLSGGQRQRISLARAFLKNAPILILDEATSALDNNSELEIQKAMEEMQGERTVVIIAHRLSTIKNSDCIVVLKQGTLVEKGNHHSLIKNNGFYSSLNKDFSR